MSPRCHGNVVTFKQFNSFHYRKFHSHVGAMSQHLNNSVFSTTGNVVVMSRQCRDIGRHHSLPDGAAFDVTTLSYSIVTLT